MGTTVPPEVPERTVRRPGGLRGLAAGSRSRDVALVAAYLAAVRGAGGLSVEVPGSPVPLSAQSLAVIGGGIALGPRRAVAGSLVYGALSAGGVRGFVPSHPSTRGYVVGFLLAAPIVGFLAQRGRAKGAAGAMAVAALGHAIILAAGAANLRREGSRDVWERGVRPFLPGALVKSAIIAAVAAMMRWSAPRLEPRVSGRGGRIRTGGPLLPKQVR